MHSPTDFQYCTVSNRLRSLVASTISSHCLTVDLFLIETATGLSRRYHFEEEQKGLAENLLQGRRFIKRKGKWVTPMEIAAEALEEGVRVLGL
jgi:hypothetical protein